MRILYVSYDGALEPVGQSQILPYLKGLAVRGAEIDLLTFEKRRDLRQICKVRQLKEDLVSLGIEWTPLYYHKRPTLFATGIDIVAGIRKGFGIIRKKGIEIIHARSYVPALMVLVIRRLLGVRFIFDMRGFWADERVDGGIWPSEGFTYRLVKRLERQFLRDADEVVTLTEKARLTVERWPGIETPRVTIIPTCVDLERFSGPAHSGPPNPSPVFIYTGSLGTWYLLGEMLRFVEEAINRFPSARFLLLTRNCEEAARELRSRRLAAETVTLASVTPAEVPMWLARADAGLAFYKPGWARQATCPTKIGEYLAMGLPVVVNDAVGDMEEIIGTNGVGAVLSDFSPEAYDRALDQLEKIWADPMLASRCRRVSESYFSLQSGVDRYWAIYQRLA
ncbi:MAG: glycosyltransferase family 4 protein [Dehalococcoidia bacterium]